MSAREQLLIVGNGMAPGRLMENLLAADPDRYDITVFNAEPRVNYNRLMLSPVLSGEKTYDDIITHDDQWYIEHGVTLLKSTRIVSVDSHQKTVVALCGGTGQESALTETSSFSYDKLVIATGSVPIRIPIPGHDLSGVLVYRDLDDVQLMLEAAKNKSRAVVIGGGLLGLEAAAGLKAQGMDVCVVHLADFLMEKQLDSSAAFLLQQEFEDRGIAVKTSTSTTEIRGDDQVTGVSFADGSELDCDLVVMAVGIRPSVSLAEDAGLLTNRGILVNDQLQTSDPSIYALGECVEHREQVYGLVAPLYEMATVLAKHLTDETVAYEGSMTATKLKVNGVDLYSAGDFSNGIDAPADTEPEEIVLRDASAGVYKRLILEDNRITGVVLFGDTADGPWFFDMLKRKVDVSDLRDMLIFGQAFAGGVALDPTEAVAALPDEAEICGCNGVCKGAITQAIKDKDLVSLDLVRTHTKASASCGSCTRQVELLMQVTLGERFEKDAVVPVCGCTKLGHEEVRRRIRHGNLTSIPAVLQALEWESSCGCAKCRPALNYYLVCEWPEQYEDDYQSRFINERAHANIQKNGTYSVVPRMWGGMTSAKELRAIADVVDKFEVPAVKVTGGQRIDLLGIRKEDLPAVWSDLGEAGFVSGHAYAKGLRTVKTCVGKQWCRFGTQDSTALGVRLERYLWGSWTPAKVKLAVSGCPRNCAEATCKDIGVICVESGYDIHFAGAAGLDIKGTEVLGHVTTEDAVLDHVAALLQMYREQGFYLERIYKWAKRVGLEAIRAEIMDNQEARKAYHKRFMESQAVAQVDPWALRAKGYQAHEFQSIQAQSLQVVA
ncbi:MAG: nitrite reductase large subunit NirB [Granulosicoccus sp.]